MDLKQLECFVAVARHEHFTRAAEALHLTQSAVSQHVLRLEAELGVRLLERTSRGATPTPAGVELLARAETILADVRRARSAVGAAATAVRVAGAAPGLAAALAAAPDALRIGFVEAAADEVLRRLRDGRADLGIAGRPADGLVAGPLRPEPLVVLGAPDGDLGGLRDRPVLLPAAGTAARYAALAAFAPAGFSPVPRFEAADPATARAIVGAGLAVGLVPASWADGEGAALPDGSPAVQRVLLHRADPAPAVVLLAAHLRAALG